MVDKAICLFRCESAPEHGTDTVKMEAQYDEPLTKEGEAFSQATPWGVLEFAVDNPHLAGFFQPGQDYYIEIRPVKQEG